MKRTLHTAISHSKIHNPFIDGDRTLLRMNTMADLRRECANRLRRSLHGREIDTLENTIEMAHMLGIVPIGAISTRKAEEGTLLDPEHDFWQEFDGEIRTKNEARRRVQSAIRSLKKDGTFRMTHPYGEEADIVYCEVDEVQQSGDVLLPTTCAECNEEIEAPLSLECTDSGSYEIATRVDCPYCDFSSVMSRLLQRK